MHFLQSESVGFPPSQSHLWIHLALAVPPHKHRAMQCKSGTHDGQPYFIWSAMQSLHPLASGDGPHASVGEIINHSSSSITDTIPCVCLCNFFSICFRSNIESCQQNLLVWVIYRPCDNLLSPPDGDATFILFWGLECSINCLIYCFSVCSIFYLIIVDLYSYCRCECVNLGCPALRPAATNSLIETWKPI